MSDPQLILVDGSGFIFRAFHALPFMQASDGTPVNAVYGFTSMLIRTLKDYPGVPLAIVFDVSRKTFRSNIYPDYKAQRPPPPDDLVPQFSLIRDATRSFGVPVVELAGWEADDIIATYATHLTKDKENCLIVSSDKDLMQLVSNNVHMLDPIKQKLIGIEEVKKKFGVPPVQVPDVQALMGDSTDNVPGVPGIGPKTASQLIQDYHNLDNVLEAAPSMKKSKRRDTLIEFEEQAKISRKLVTLATDVPLPLSPREITPPQPDEEYRRQWLLKMGFTSLLSRIDHHDQSSSKSRQETPQSSVSPKEKLTSLPYENYHIIRDEKGVELLLQQIKLNGFCAITIRKSFSHAHILGLTFTTNPNESYYLPFSDGTLAQSTALSFDDLRPALSDLLYDPAILKIFHNAKHHIICLDKQGIPLELCNAIDDTMLMSYSQSAGRYKHDLVTLANHYLSHVPSLPEHLTTAKRQKDFAQSSLEDIAKNYCEAGDTILRLWLYIRPELLKSHALALYEYMERPLIKILASMEKDGIKINCDELDHLSHVFEQKMAHLQETIYEEAGQKFNLASPKQLGDILFNVLQLKGGKKTKTGAWRTDSNILEILAREGHILPSNVLLWRKYAKLKSTYTEALTKLADKNHRLHTTFQMAITSTGRLSSTDPNIQNIPIRSQEGEAIRRSFIARDGYRLISADYSQIELRLLAHVADIPSLKDAFLHGRDIHTQTAAEIFDIDPHHMDPMVRRQAKAINFGIIYGISAFGLSQQLSISQAEAKNIIEKYFARYPGIQNYMDVTVAQAKEQGYVSTPFGRRCYIPQITAHNKNVRQYAQRQAINAPLQGGGADIIKKAMVRLDHYLAKDSTPPAKMCLQVHDELLIETPTEYAQQLAISIKEIMENVVKLSVPLKIDTGIGQNWSQAH